MKYKLAQLMMENLKANYVHVKDDSDQHRGHRGVAQVGNTHFAITIVSNLFENEPLIQRHRRVYEITKPLQDRGLHALQLITKSPQEWNGDGHR